MNAPFCVFLAVSGSIFDAVSETGASHQTARTTLLVSALWLRLPILFGPSLSCNECHLSPR